MKEYKVYVLKDKLGEIIYVGMSSRTLKERYIQHTKPTARTFPNRKDLTIHLTDTYNTKVEALDREATIKFLLGFRNQIISDDAYAGRIGGPLTLKNKIGLFDPKNKQKCLEGNIKGGKIGGKRMKELHSKPVLVYTKNGQFIGEYPSQHEAARQMDINHSGINMVIKGKIKTYKGHIFKQKLTI